MNKSKWNPQNYSSNPQKRQTNKQRNKTPGKQIENNNKMANVIMY